MHETSSYLIVNSPQSDRAVIFIIKVGHGSKFILVPQRASRLLIIIL